MRSNGTLSARMGSQQVQAYAIKRAAQLEHARKLREERERNMRAAEEQLHQQQQPPPPQQQQQHSTHHYEQNHQPPPEACLPRNASGGSLSRQSSGSSANATANSRSSFTKCDRKVAQPPEPSSPSSLDSDASVVVREKDLLTAVKAGILTLDQCQKLWGELLRRAPPASDWGVETVPVTRPSHKTNGDGGRAGGNAVYTPSQYVRSQASEQVVQRTPHQYTADRDVPVPDGSLASFEALEKQCREDQPAVRAKGPSPKAKPESKGGWNFDTEVRYDDYEPDDVFLHKQPHGKNPTRNRQTASRPEWKSTVEEPTSSGFGEPPNLPRKSAPGGGRQSAKAPPRQREVDDSSADPPARRNPMKGGRVEMADYRSQGQGHNTRETRRTSFEVDPSPGLPVEEMDIHTAKSMAANDQLEEDAMRAQSEPTDLCPQCGRTFRVSILNRHAATCGRTKPRKVFNAAKQRQLDEAQSIRPPPSNAPDKKPASAVPKWKAQHEQFQAAMKANKLATKVESGQLPASALASLPPPPDDRVPCQHCGRKFAPDVAERHIPKCRNIFNKPKGLRR